MRIPVLRTVLDDVALRHNDKIAKEKMKEYAENHGHIRRTDIGVGDLVLVKNCRTSKSEPYYDPEPYVVIYKKGTMITARRKDRKITRNATWFKVIPDDSRSSENSDFDGGSAIFSDSPEDEEAPTNEGPELRRSTRVTAQPVRYPMDVPQ